MKNIQLILYAFLALSITLLPAACAPLDSGPTGTLAQKKEEPPEQEWKLSQVTEKQRGRRISGLSVDPRTSVLSVMVENVIASDTVASIMIRRFSIPSNRNLFPLKFYTGDDITPVPAGSENLEEKVEICYRSVCRSDNKDLNDVVFNSKGKLYILDSTRDELSGLNEHIRIIAFTRNVRNRDAHPREVLAGSFEGNVDAAGTSAEFREGVRNMALSTDEKYIYAADWMNNSVRAVEIESKKVTTLKPTDAAGKAVGLPYPTGIAVGKGNGKSNTVYAIRNSGGSGKYGGTGEIAALTVPLPLPADNKVRARVLKLIDEKTGKAYQLRDKPVWYLAIDDNGVLYSHIQRASKRYIVRIRLKDANAEDLVGMVSEIAVMHGVKAGRSNFGGDSIEIAGLEVSGDGKTIYYTNGDDVYAYTQE